MDLVTDSDGNAQICPILEWEVRIAPNRTIALLLDYTATAEDARLGRPTRLQLFMPHESATEFAAALAEYAEELARRIGAEAAKPDGSTVRLG